MMKLYFLLVLLAFSSASQAQKSEGTPVKGIIPIERVVEQERSSLSSNSPLSFESKAQASTALVPTGSSTEVGLTAGQLLVSLTGAAKYSLPINVPLGINGVEPKVGLIYNSQGSDGMATNQWDVFGISKITRISKNKFHDGKIEEIKLTAQDRFALDGQRLMLKSGVYGANNSVYETENYSNVKVTMIYGLVPPYEESIYYFKVEYPDGSKAMYGNTFDALSGNEWAIVSWENAQGIKINYSYNNQPLGFLSIASIKYGSKGATAPINEIKFTYGPSEKVTEGYINGYKITRNSVLTKIEVKSNAVGFRNYSIAYTTGDRILSITEKSGDNSKSYNPLVFSYQDTQDNISYIPVEAKLDIGNINVSNAATISGDFDDDGKMDCIIYPTLGPDSYAKYYLYYNISSGGNTNLGFAHPVGAFEKIFTTSWLSWNNKVMPQGWTVAKKVAGGLEFKVYSVGTVAAVYEQYTRTVSFPTVPVLTKCYTNCNSEIVNKSFPKKFVSGDFNGDGLTDVVTFDLPLTTGECYLDDLTLSKCEIQESYLISKKVYFVDLKRDNTTDFLKYTGELAEAITEYTDIKVADFNGDGKSDFFIFSPSNLKVYTLNESNNLVLLYQTTGYDTVLDGQLIFGDFNGDGKADFMASPPYGSAIWYKYTSTGNSYLKQAKTYTGVQLPNNSSTIANSQFIGIDYNNDRKTDIALITSSTINPTSGNINIQCFTNINGDFKSGNGFSVIANSGPQATLTSNVLPIFVSPTQTLSRDNSFSTSTFEVAFANKNKIHFFSSAKNTVKDNLISSITTGDGVKEIITYSPMNTAYKNIYNSIYTPSAGLSNYPNYDISINPNFYLVSKVEKQSSDVYKKRLFAYYGAVVSLERNVFIGFRSVSQSDWHDDSSVIFSKVFNNNIDLRGANEEIFTVPYMYYPYGTSASDFVSKSVLTYDAANPLQTNKVFKLKNNTVTESDSRYNTNVKTTILYNGNNNPLSKTVVTKENSSEVKTLTETLTYLDPVPAGRYIVDFPSEKIVSIKIPGKTIEYTDSYEYGSDLLLSGVIKETSGTYAKRESYLYDGSGNLIEKSILAPSQGSRPTYYQYDPSGRFLTKVTDSDNLVSTFEYNANNGLLIKETNPYALSTSYTYDSWFKRLTAKDDQLNKTITYTYLKTTSAENSPETTITTTVKNSDGLIESTLEEKFDDLGRKKRRGIKDLTGTFSYTSFLYDIFDRNYKISKPYFGATPSQWNETKFDIYSRPTQTILFNNKVVSASYSGLETTISDGPKSKTIVKNAIGNIVSTRENGENINFSYFPDGNLNQTNYNGIGIIIEEDGWGQKSKLTDPSAGTFDYSYNTYGEMVKVISEGDKITEIIRDDNGRVNRKTIVGGGTNSETTYTYNALKLPLTITYVDKNEPLATQKTITSITYDNVFKRPITIDEEKTGVSKFTRTFGYDALGRISLETKTAKLGTKTSTVTTKNIYKNDNLYQIQDLNNKVLWQANTVSAEGEVLESILGNGIKITNTYNSDGYLSKIQHDKTTNPLANIITLTTVFDKTTDNLDSRVNSAFGNYTESFKYDDISRLKKFTNKFGIEETQNYDPSGKITDNSLGTYQYDSTKKYQNNAITITPEATGYYANREGMYSDSMEGRTGWSLGAYNPQCISFDNTKAHTGTNSVKINTSLPGVTVSYVQSDVQIPINNKVDTQYTFSGWVYSNAPTAQLTLFQYNANETGYYSYVNSSSTTTLNTWVPIEMTVLVPASVKNLRLRLDVIGVGNVWFDDVKIRKTSEPISPLKQLNISYNAFKNPIQIEETSVDKISFTYNDNYQRSTMYYGALGDKLVRPFRKHYSADGTMEVKENIVTNNAEFVFYIAGDAYTAPIVVKGDGTSQNYLYLHRDYQGTILAVTNDNAAIVEKRLFDAWGSIIKVQDGSGNSLLGLTVLDRGYTGHEHLQSGGLINMNARLYDPILHRFLQVDSKIQDPTNTQNYNQYGYVFNNPTKFIDPTGNAAYDPPGGTNHQDGKNWDDDDGHWVYDANFQTWFGVNGTRDITVDAVNLPNLVLGGNMNGYDSNVTPFSGMTGDVFGSAGANTSFSSWASASRNQLNTGPVIHDAPSLGEANRFYNDKNRGTDEYWVDASTVDLNSVNIKGWTRNSEHIVQTLYNSKQGLVFGKLKLIYRGNNQVNISDDVYDFNLEFSNPLKVREFLAPRNIFTGFAQLYAGNGTSFTFRFDGLNTINHNKLIITNSYKQYP